jgi:hypothetical protein
MNDNVIRVKADDIVILQKRFLILSLLEPGIAADAVGVSVLGIESDGLAAVRDGLVVFLLGKPGGAADFVGVLVARIESDGLADVRDRLFILLLSSTIAVLLSAAGLMYLRHSDASRNRLCSSCIEVGDTPARQTVRLP